MHADANTHAYNYEICNYVTYRIVCMCVYFSYTYVPVGLILMNMNSILRERPDQDGCFYLSKNH